MEFRLPADKGSLTMKMYGKQSVFVYNQVSQNESDWWGNSYKARPPIHRMFNSLHISPFPTTPSPSILLYLFCIPLPPVDTPIPQDDLDTLPAEALAELDNEIKVVLDDVDSMKKKLRILTSGELM